jgi:DHA2 family multidrug resistance protein-like MFS transporter
VFVVMILFFFKIETSKDQIAQGEQAGLQGGESRGSPDQTEGDDQGAGGPVEQEVGQGGAGEGHVREQAQVHEDLIAILATIRVGEKLLQRFGPKKPMLWGSTITAVGILMTSATFVLIDQYIVLAFIGFTLCGIGLGFYATPSTDAALSNVPDAKAGSAAGICKMASSLGAAFGVAISAAIFAAGQAIDPSLIPMDSIFMGRQDNIALRFGGAVGLLFNVFMCLIAIIAIMVTVPSERARAEKEKAPEVPATPMLGP